MSLAEEKENEMKEQQCVPQYVREKESEVERSRERGCAREVRSSREAKRGSEKERLRKRGREREADRGREREVEKSREVERERAGVPA